MRLPTTGISRTLALTAILLCLSGSPQPPNKDFGKRPSELLNPRTLEQIQQGDLRTIEQQIRIFGAQHLDMMRQMAVLSQHVADLEKRLDIHRTELDALEPSHNGERIAHLEDFMERHEREQERERQEGNARWESLNSWGRVILTATLGLLLSEWWKRRRERRQRKVRESAVDESLDTIKRALAERRGDGQGGSPDLGP